MKNLSILLLLFTASAEAGKEKIGAPNANALDRYVSDADARSSDNTTTTPGSIWTSGSRLADSARDLRASQIDDILTIVVAEQASAVAT
jgi:flagellar basal body L-ring protein FlgH